MHAQWVAAAASTRTTRWHRFLCHAPQPADCSPGFRRTLSVLSSGRAVAQSMTVDTPTIAAGSEEGSVRSACGAVCKAGAQKSGQRTAGCMQRATYATPLHKPTAGTASPS